MDIKMRTKHTRTCPICNETFEIEHVRQVCDTDRCKYIRTKLARAPAQAMSRADAIKYYGGLYDSPVRGLVKSKYKVLVIAIHDLCVERESREFVYSELPPHIKDMYGDVPPQTSAVKIDTLATATDSQLYAEVQAHPERKEAILAEIKRRTLPQ